MKGQVPNRPLRKALARCPECGRILKVRLRWKEKRLAPPSYRAPEQERYDFSVHEIPKHKHYMFDPHRLEKVVLSGKAPDEHPWCSVHSHNVEVRFKPNAPDTPHYRRHWEFIRWR